MLISDIKIKLDKSSNSDAPIVSLEGPFLSEGLMIKNKELYPNELFNFSKYNHIIVRDMTVLTSDMGYESRDNIRIQIGIKHHFHNIEIICVGDDFKVFAIDKFILLNPIDCQNLKNCISFSNI